MILKNTNNAVIVKYSHEMNINITVLSTRFDKKIVTFSGTR